MPSRVASPLPGDNKDGEPQVQTPIQVFVAALTMVQYNAAYLAWTQGALNVGDVDGVGGTLELLGATVTSEGIGLCVFSYYGSDIFTYLVLPGIALHMLHPPLKNTPFLHLHDLLLCHSLPCLPGTYHKLEVED